MEPQWLTIVSWVALGLGFGSALLILTDELVGGHRQQMWIMNLVHPITALYWGPIWLWIYVRRGRWSSQKLMQVEARRLAARGADPERLREQAAGLDDLRPWHVADAVSHCGAGCTLGDIGGEWIVWGLGPATLGVSGSYGAELIADFALAWTFGVAFQYFTIVPMRENVGRLDGIRQAIKVDTLSILAFQLGLFGWMALSHFVIWQPPLPIDTSGHWFMMQIGMIVGFFTAWPVNRWLVRTGIKEKMDRRGHLAMLVERAQDEQRTSRTAAVGAP